MFLQKSPCVSVLVNVHNIDELESEILNAVKASSLLGFDIETQDVNAHEGIKRARKESEDGDRAANAKLVFDWRRMVVTGASLYPDSGDKCYYFDLNHVEEGNRLPWVRLKKILDSKPKDASFICHNAPFELTVMHNTYGYVLPNVICTMQMACSAYGPDEYRREDFVTAQLGQIPTLFPEVSALFKEAQLEDGDILDDGEEVKSKKLNSRQQDLLNKVIGKQSKASYSYNGLTRELSYGYGLKKVIKTFFGFQMTTFEEVLAGRQHMGQLKASEVVDYGCDDAYWAVKLFIRLYEFMMDSSNPQVVTTFFEQENPMIYVYADIRQEGMVVNKSAIEHRRNVERSIFASKLRELKNAMNRLLPFRPELDEKLAKHEDWYGPNKKKKTAAKGNEYRTRLEQWIKSPNVEDDFKMACQVSNAVSNSWAGKKVNALSITHYYQARLIMYDLCQIPAIIYKGKVASDAECRGEVREKIGKLKVENPDKTEFYTQADEVVKLLGEISGVEQRMKLYLTPYLNLTDPETNRLYPEVSSQLATRRLAASNPNPMQLGKRGESTYIRGFYLPDSEDEVLVSLDWSQIELVLIGEFSGDAEFAKAYGQLPYNDLHLGAAADILKVDIEGVTEELLKNLHKTPLELIPPKLLLKPNGDSLTPSAAKKYWRTEVGKGSNFNYWYSGALSTVGDRMGWSSDKMWDATEAYRERFPEAEQWRINLIAEGRQNGFITLPDGHTRVKYEATYDWMNIAQRMFDAYQDAGVSKFGKEVIRATKTRAGNQLVNAMIQGSCATLAKRSVIKINQELARTGIRARFKMPIHDELLFSVHKDDVTLFIALARKIMCNHPEIIKNLKMHCTASVGLTFEPFDNIKAPKGQIELDECPEVDFIPSEYWGKELPAELYQSVIGYLYGK